MDLGFYTTGSGTYSLSGGSLAFSGNLVVGGSGSGNFVQTGGVNTIASSSAIYIGAALGANGFV